MKTNSRLKPLTGFKISRRNLPHWQDPGSVYFVTFNTLPGNYLSDDAKQIIFDAIRFHAGVKYHLYAYVVMSTHVHVMLSPLESSNNTYFSLSQIMHSIKRYSTNRIQRLLPKKGSVWQAENYDRIVRNDDEFQQEIEYIIGNPLKAGIVTKPEKYRWLFYEGM